jgi:hypothetical protein
MSKCKHKPSRLFSWFITDENGKQVLCAGCCDCGESFMMQYPFHKVRPANKTLKEVRESLN